MKYSIKKLLAILAIACVILSFSAIPVNALVERTYTLAPGGDGDLEMTADNLTLYGDNLFGKLPVLYPGEAAEFNLQIINDAENIQTVTMTVRDISEDKYELPNLANYITLIVTENGSEVHNQKLLEYGTKTYAWTLPPANGTRMYHFRAEFNATYDNGKNEGDKYDNQNELMTLSAAFVIEFAVTYIEIITGTDPTPGPTTTESAQTTTTTSESPTQPTIEEPTTETPATTEITTEPTIDELTSEDELPATTTEEDELVDETDASVPQADADFVGPTQYIPTTTTAPQITTEEELVDMTEASIPKGDAEFIDQMPVTGEKTNPFIYSMTGLMFILTGSITIVGVSRKSKEKENK